MKKAVIVLLILGAACGWGWYEGKQDVKDFSHTGTQQSASLQTKSQSSDTDRALSIARGTFSAVRSSAEDIKNGLAAGNDTEGTIVRKDSSAPPSRSTVQDEQKEENAADKINDIRNFKQALESRIHRENFVPLNEIPQTMRQAIVTTEDKRYYSHGAIDPIGIMRAMIINYRAGGTVEGGSTIAQQTVKNIFLSNERTLSRKIEELVLAVQLEKNYSKDQILELYLNTIYFGHGAYGIREASEIYFHKEPKDLNLAQCAMLAGLPQAPSAYDPIDHPEAGMNRMKTVLSLMEEAGLISPEERAAAPSNLWNRHS